MSYFQALVKGLDAAVLKSFEVDDHPMEVTAPFEACQPNGPNRLQFGENGHAEYGVSNEIQERIVQFHFQLTRASNSSQLANLRKMLEELLYTLKAKYLIRAQLSENDNDKVKVYLRTLYSILGQTRDIVAGKGERLLSFLQLEIWHRYFPTLAKIALQYMTKALPGESHQYGCWKDPYGLYQYLQSLHSIGEKGALTHPLTVFGHTLYTEQMKCDEQIVLSKYASTTDNNNDEDAKKEEEEQKKKISLSLVAKWIPRETTDKDYYKALAIQYYPQYLATTNKETNEVQYKKAILKCKIEYRKLLARCNAILETTQINQCGKDWSSIDFDRVTSITIARQKHAFLNIDGKTRQKRYAENPDREECAKKFQAHIEVAVKNPNKEVKGGRVEMTTFVSQAIELGKLLGQTTDTYPVEKALLNSQWRDNSNQMNGVSATGGGGALSKIIPMVDVSSSMRGDPMLVAIGLGIRISEQSSILPHRCLTFHTTPSWVDLSPFDNFVDKVNHLVTAPWGGSTNFQKAFEMILDQLVTQRLPPEAVKDVVLVILSDMQIDSGDYSANESMYAHMKRRFAEEGRKLFQQPYALPHLIFWNLRSTTGFPSLAKEKHTSMMSGYSPALLNIFCEEGMSALDNCTPWQVLVKSLHHTRYEPLHHVLEEELYASAGGGTGAAAEKKGVVGVTTVTEAEEEQGQQGSDGKEKKEEEDTLPDWNTLDFQLPKEKLFYKHIRPEAKHQLQPQSRGGRGRGGRMSRGGAGRGVGGRGRLFQRK